MDIEAATLQLHQIFDCGRRAGIEHAMFLNFGTLLGVVRERGLIEHDSDTDIGVRSDWISKSQELAFYEELCKANLFMFRRRRARRADINRYLWNSLRSKRHGPKCCIWYMFPWGKHLYHCKGRRWLRKIGLKPAVIKLLPNHGRNIQEHETIMKGNSLNCFESLVKIKVLGGKFNIPAGYGQLLDEYYEDWGIPRSGASMRHRIVLIGKWSDENTWLILKE
jgi:hypothetical protein